METMGDRVASVSNIIPHRSKKPFGKSVPAVSQFTMPWIEKREIEGIKP
jgi:hypothetical protein